MLYHSKTLPTQTLRNIYQPLTFNVEMRSKTERRVLFFFGVEEYKFQLTILCWYIFVHICKFSYYLVWLVYEFLRVSAYIIMFAMERNTGYG